MHKYDLRLELMVSNRAFHVTIKSMDDSVHRTVQQVLASNTCFLQNTTVLNYDIKNCYVNREILHGKGYECSASITANLLWQGTVEARGLSTALNKAVDELFKDVLYGLSNEISGKPRNSGCISYNHAVLSGDIVGEGGIISLRDVTKDVQKRIEYNIRKFNKQ